MADALPYRLLGAHSKNAPSLRVNTEAKLSLFENLKNANHSCFPNSNVLYKWLLLVLLLLICIVVYICKTTPAFQQYYKRHQCYSCINDSTRSQPRTILLWNTFFGDKRWNLPEDTIGPEFFRHDLKCPVYSCELTNDKHFLPELDMYDAVLFHTAEPIPMLGTSVPAQRSSHQLYVFALKKPPSETNHRLSDEGGFYNLTMTYRLDSDIVWPNYFVQEIETGVLVAPKIQPDWRKPPSIWNATDMEDPILNKTKMVAWFESDCETVSQREKLAAKLSKFINVDIYGKCGNKRCEINNSPNCNQMLDKDYKFYLSFEKVLCTDYVSETFYNALERQIVPVVFGGADYKRFAPPRSYINAEDFESIEELAEYMRYLDTHAEAYMQYFWWRKFYRLTHRSPFCKICEMLHSKTYRLKSQFYSNIEEWWLGDACRFEAKIDLE